MDIAELLDFSVKHNASDLHLSAGVSPIRIRPSRSQFTWLCKIYWTPRQERFTLPYVKNIRQANRTSNGHGRFVMSFVEKRSWVYLGPYRFSRLD